MPGRRSGRAKEEGLERTDNDLEFTSWPQVTMINQKNYYTEFLKRDDQILALRLQHEENRNRMAKAARDRDRALAQSAQNGAAAADGDIDMDDNDMTAENLDDSDAHGSKVVVIHVGSQNLRIGLASDALPKIVPMVIARKSSEAESENVEPRPKRRKINADTMPEADKMFDEDFKKQFGEMCVDLKGRMRSAGKRFVPNSREVAISYNRKASPDMIPEHNDTNRIDWTEIPSDLNRAPDHIVGHAALRIPDQSTPRYRLFWPIRHGYFNERDYSNKAQLYRDFAVIIEEAIKSQLGLSRTKDWNSYDCVFVIPDLYERTYVTTILDLLLREFNFNRVCFVQESVSASYGAAVATCVIVDIGAQKTSVCCVEEGMCVEQSRINMKYGGNDVTETFMKMLLHDSFPYADMNLTRRYDFLLAEELKQKFCTLFVADIAVSQHEFYLRVFGQNTRHYLFKTYDEVTAAPMGYYRPSIFDTKGRLDGRRKLIPRSTDLYDGSPNDPISSSQAQVLAMCSQTNGHVDGDTIESSSQPLTSTPRHQQHSKPLDGTPKLKITQSPAQDDGETPQPGRQGSPALDDKEAAGPKNPIVEMTRSAEVRDSILPCIPLDQAIVLSIENATKGDERKTRDFFGGILTVGGGVQTRGFREFLEAELKETQARYRKEVFVAPPPREIDPQVLVWKGASVFGKLRGTNDSWIGRLEYDRLGSRVLAYKCLWNW